MENTRKATLESLLDTEHFDLKNKITFTFGICVYTASLKRAQLIHQHIIEQHINSNVNNN